MAPGSSACRRRCPIDSAASPCVPTPWNSGCLAVKGSHVNVTGPPKRSALDLSVVAPVFNEEDGIEEFHRRLAGVLDRLEISSEIIYVNDGSADRSLEILQQIQSRDSRLTVVDLSRNFGK